LPEGAVARCGTVRFRLALTQDLLPFCPDGKTVLTLERPLTVQFWDAATGVCRLRIDGGQDRCWADDVSFLAAGHPRALQSREATAALERLEGRGGE
jgi:hypothetical protein